MCDPMVTQYEGKGIHVQQKHNSFAHLIDQESSEDPGVLEEGRGYRFV